MGFSISRVFAATPDALTSAIFLTAWIAPSVLGPQWVKNLMLTVLIEFVVMHSSAFYSAITNNDGSRIKQALMLTVLTAFYSIFIAAFSFAFDSTWPMFAFGWLFISRFIHLWTNPSSRSKAAEMMVKSWAASAGFYLAGVFLTIILPLPKFGLTHEFVASMHLSGSGLWIDQPQTAIVFGMLYFAAQSWFKYYMAATDSSTRDPASGNAVT